MNNFFKVPMNEQETIVLVDYELRVMHIYTSREACFNKLCKLLGEPYKTVVFKKCICSGEWIIPFDDRTKIRIATRLTNLIPRNY